MRDSNFKVNIRQKFKLKFERKSESRKLGNRSIKYQKKHIWLFIGAWWSQTWCDVVDVVQYDNVTCFHPGLLSTQSAATITMVSVTISSNEFSQVVTDSIKNLD